MGGKLLSMLFKVQRKKVVTNVFGMVVVPVLQSVCQIKSLIVIVHVVSRRMVVIVLEKVSR